MLKLYLFNSLRARKEKMKKLITAVIIASAIIFLGASCYNSNSNSSSPSNSTPVSTNQVTIQNMAFSPQSITVTKGTTVNWVNNDSVTHTVTGDNNAFSSGQLAPGANFSFTFPNSGTFTYHCSIHPSMTAQVTVN